MVVGALEDAVVVDAVVEGAVAVEDAVVVDAVVEGAVAVADAVADAATARPCIKQERHKHASPGSGGPVGGTCMHQQSPVGLHSISAPQRLHDGIFVSKIGERSHSFLRSMRGAVIDKLALN